METKQAGPAIVLQVGLEGALAERIAVLERLVAEQGAQIKELRAKLEARDAPDRLLRKGDVAAQLGVSRRTVDRLIEEGILPSVKPPMGGGPRVPAAAVRQYVQAHLAQKL